MEVARYEGRNGRLSLAGLNVKTEEITFSKLYLLDMRQFDTDNLTAVKCMYSIGDLSHWVRPGLRIWLGPFIHLFIHSVDSGWAPSVPWTEL